MLILGPLVILKNKVGTPIPVRDATASSCNILPIKPLLIKPIVLRMKVFGGWALKKAWLF